MQLNLDNQTKTKPIEGLQKSPKITINSDRLRTLQQVHALAIILIPLVGSAVALIIASRSGISWMELGILLSMYILNVIGITVGFHRHFAHCAFQTYPVVRIILAILGSMACQGPLIYWVSNHRRHHQYSDLPGDPHSPYFKEEQPLSQLQGLWHAHIGWTFDHEITNTFLFAKDLLRDQVISKVNQLYYFWILLGLVIPTLLGAVLSRTWMGALTGFLWGGCVRLLLAYHVTLSINSFTHLYGSRPFNTREHSTNNIWLAVPSFGEAWHNNHHAFPNSAVFGLKWWQIDLGSWVLWSLEKVGLVWDIKVPTAAMIKAKRTP